MTPHALEGDGIGVPVSRNCSTSFGGGWKLVSTVENLELLSSICEYFQITFTLVVY